MAGQGNAEEQPERPGRFGRKSDTGGCCFFSCRGVSLFLENTSDKPRGLVQSPSKAVRFPLRSPCVCTFASECWECRRVDYE